MAPDFEYFVRGQESGAFGHTALGLVVWCLPATLVVGLLWHHVVKWPLITAAPWAIACRIAPRVQPWRFRAVAFVASALIGAASHDLWDSFTHGPGFFVRRWAVLHSITTVPLLGRIAVHRLLQYICSVVGLVVLALLAARALRRLKPVDLPPVPAWKARGVLTACIGVGVAASGYRIVALVHQTDPGDVVVAIISGWLAGMLVASLILRRDGLFTRSVSGRRDT